MVTGTSDRIATSPCAARPATLYVGSLKYIMEENPETGAAGGWFNSVASLASILGPILGGFVAAVSYILTFWVADASAILALAVYLCALRRTQKARGASSNAGE
jgi:MFS family permease